MLLTEIGYGSFGSRFVGNSEDALLWKRRFDFCSKYSVDEKWQSPCRCVDLRTWFREELPAIMRNRASSGTILTPGIPTVIGENRGRQQDDRGGPVTESAESVNSGVRAHEDRPSPKPGPLLFFPTHRLNGSDPDEPVLVC
jgi:hypothetical protein